MNVPDPLCSTGCFSRDPDLSSIDLVTRGMRALPETSFEVIFYSTWHDAAPAIARAIVATGAPTPVLHAEKSIGPAFARGSEADRQDALDLFEVNCRFAESIGARRMVLHLWGLPDSDTRLDQNLAALPRLLDTTDRQGDSVSICGVQQPR